MLLLAAMQTLTRAVDPEERQRYTSIIDGILATADLSTISRKRIRQGLETSLGGKDLSEQKVRHSLQLWTSLTVRRKRSRS